MTSIASGRNAAAQIELADDPQGRGMRYSRIFGALFLAGFLVYGVGFALVSSVTTAPDLFAAVSEHAPVLALGTFLMLLNTVVDIGKGVLFFPIAERHGKRTALVYLAAITVQVMLLDLGALFLLLLVPLAELASGANAGWATATASLLSDANAVAFNIAQATLGFGALFMTWLLVRARLVPRWLAVWGVVGYTIHVSGAIAEIFGVPVGLVLSLPGGFFELAFGVWLMAKGFSSTVVMPRADRAGGTPTPEASMAAAR